MRTHTRRWRDGMCGGLAGAVLFLMVGAADPGDRGSPAGPPVGTIVAFGGPVTTALEDQGWMVCDGRTLSVSEFGTLHAAIGGSWGEDSEGGLFNLPDLRGRFVRGVHRGAPGAWRDPDAEGRLASGPGGNVGDREGTLQGDSVGFHHHDLVGVGNASGPGADGGWIRFYAAKVPDDEAPVVRNGSVVMPAEGRETRPANVAVNWMIRVR